MSKTVKRVFAPLALAAVFILAGVLYYTNTEAGTVTINLPYLHTSNSMVTYCMVSNTNFDNATRTDNTTSDTTATFKVMATERGAASQTTHTFPAAYTPRSGVMQMYSFRQNAIYNGTGAQVVSLSDEFPANVLNAYSGKMTITSSTASCQTITLACMQATTDMSGKRYVGYTCSDGTNILSY